MKSYTLWPHPPSSSGGSRCSRGQRGRTLGARQQCQTVAPKGRKERFFSLEKRRRGQWGRTRWRRRCVAVLLISFVANVSAEKNLHFARLAYPKPQSCKECSYLSLAPLWKIKLTRKHCNKTNSRRPVNFSTYQIQALDLLIYFAYFSVMHVQRF